MDRLISLSSPSPTSPVADAMPMPSTEQPLDNAFELDERGEIARPEMLLTDWIELVLLAVLLLLGLPLNIVALSKQLSGRTSPSLFNPRKTSRISRQEVTRTNFHWLKLHLTIMDLLVIACYCPSHIAWLIGYTWSAGPILCKAMQYSWDFCFHLVGLYFQRRKAFSEHLK
uniref:G_PROTEIN_RECEP_F1_2 domain-containing protein n=1 Tax=Globodera pallida TaxID=36090 RepID=A0A183CIC7_GLOPA